MRNISDRVVEKIETLILCSVTCMFFLPKTFPFGKIIVELDRPQVTKWRMRIACWIGKATDTHSKYVINT
jgi:hypothetical protein